MQRSGSKPRRPAALLLPAAALLVVLLQPLRLRLSAFATPAGSSPAPPRRLALGSLLPLLLPTASTGASAGEASRVVRPLPGGGQLAFQLPPDAKDWVVDEKTPPAEARFDRKDGAFIAMMPAPAGYVKGRINYEAGPGNGFRLEKLSQGADEDILEWTKLATIYKGAAGGGVSYGGFLLNDGDPTSYHQWIRVLHGPRGDVLMSVAVLQEKFADEGAALKEVVDSFRLEA
uniref:PsbP C-terminal domain-containing protein n=1 Tax=Alexandrium catenella TaxID=2925 RepID=A0A7S1KVD0_ALECA